MQLHEIDQHLALLSLRAAEEIDLRLDGKEVKSSVLKDLSQYLKAASGLGRPHERAFLNSDPSTTEIFAQAVRAAYTEPLKDIDHLSKAVQKIIAPLEADKHLSVNDLAAIKSFCLAFHRSMMAHKPRKLNRDRFKDDRRAG